MYHDTDIEVVYKCAKTQGFYFVRIVGASDFYSVLVFFLNYCVDAEDYERGLVNFPLSWASSGRKRETIMS